MKYGKVFLVGAGPGDPDLITVKGRKILQEAEVIVYDRLIDKGILKYTNPASKLICADSLDKRKYSNGFCKRQDLINRLLVNEAKKGKKVLRLKNGDPFIFSRANEEMKSLAEEKIEFSVVPGVTAANAASSYSGVPLTSRDSSSSVVFVTGHEDPKKKTSSIDWEAIAKSGTIALYMAVENITKIAKKLIDNGKDKDTPVIIVSNVSKIGQKSTKGTLGNIGDKVKKEKIRPPAIALIGKAVNKEEFNWFRKARKVLFTGLSDERFYKKGIIYHLPLIEIKPLRHYMKLDSFIRKINIFDWIVFTSRYGVLYFFERLFKSGYDSRSLNEIKIATIGNSTANKLKEYGIITNLIPKKESSKGLLSEFKKIGIKGEKILLPRSDIADKGLTKGLGTQGADVYPCNAYKNVMPKGLPDLDLTNFNEIIFTSPSTVRNFKKRYKKIPRGVKIGYIGDVTLKEAERCKLLNKTK